ncbi:MAG: ECF-type sigma factor [Lysobacterales bacterium]
MDADADITQWLIAASNGDLIARDNLVAHLYDRLHDLAHSQIKRTGGAHTLCTTAVVNEAYLKLFDRQSIQWENRNHFFGCAAIAMRRLLIDYVRKRQAAKRSPEVPMSTLQPDQAPSVELDLDGLLELDKALTQLSEVDPRLGELVQLRFFSGLSVEQISELQQCSARTVVRDWRRARAFLNAAIAP